jgi:hypothetical protein
MKSPASQTSKSKKRNRALIANFAGRTIAKNDRGIKEHGGGLEKKNTLPEMMAEIMDLVNYAVEHEEQVEALVDAAVYVQVSWDWGSDRDTAQGVEKLRAALGPFLNKPEKGND